MARIDAPYLENPCSGSRWLVEYLAREGIPISRDRVRNLMHRMAFDMRLTKNPAPPCQATHPSDFPVWWTQAGQGSELNSCDKYHHHHAPARISLPDGGRKSVLQKRAQLEALEPP